MDAPPLLGFGVHLGSKVQTDPMASQCGLQMAPRWNTNIDMTYTHMHTCIHTYIHLPTFLGPTQCLLRAAQRNVPLRPQRPWHMPHADVRNVGLLALGRNVLLGHVLRRNVLLGHVLCRNELLHVVPIDAWVRNGLPLGTLQRIGPQ